MIRFIPSIACLLLITLLSGCISVQRLKNSDPYVLHHHNWWNYYTRGKLHVRDRDYKAAQFDFETAIGMRQGARSSYVQERWRVRTYGMHRLEGYFPHRELGICLYEQQQYTQALEWLKTSMQLEPSARAKFYINRIHEKLAITVTPPTLQIDSIPPWTTQETQHIQGHVLGANPVQSVQINDNSEFIELFVMEQPFSRILDLVEGKNTIHLSARDLADNVTQTNVVLMADWTSPTIHLERTSNLLSIHCQDNLSLHDINVNGRNIHPTSNDYVLTHALTDTEPLNVVLTDEAGNKLEWMLTESELDYLAHNNQSGPPIFSLTDKNKTITLNTDEYMLDFTVGDETALQSVKLNGQNLLTKTTPVFRMAKRIALQEGRNKLLLQAEDNEGNNTQEIITVIYRSPEYRDQLYRLAAMIKPIEEEFPDFTLKQRISGRMGYELTRSPIRFHLLATDQETQKLMNEQRLSESDLADSRVLLKSGKIRDAELIMSTRILRDGQGITVYTQVLDTHSNDELFVEDVYIEDQSNLPRKLSGLVMKIEQRFPLIQARITLENKNSFINAGINHGVQEGMRFLLIRSSGALENGRLIQNNNQPVELVASDIESNRAQVIMSTHKNASLAQPGDYVYSR